MKTSAFIGPLPPPLGGVAIINQSFQTIDYNGYDVISFDTAKKKEREDVYAKFKLKSIQRNIQMSNKLTKFIKEDQPDVINIFITSGMSILRDLLFLKKLSQFNIPIIIHFHSKTKGEFALTSRRLKWVARYFNKYASRIILLSEYHYAYFTNYFEAEKCVVIENFVNYVDFENEIETKNNDFLFVGRLSREKGFFDLIDAIKILKQKNIFCRIQIIGVAPTKEVEFEINQLITEHGLSNYFIFNGATYGEAKNTLFKQSRCLIFPSHFENSPVVLKEAIAAKMGILSSDIRANENVLLNHANFVSFQKANSNDLAQKIIDLVSSPEEMQRMCEVSSTIKNYDVSVAQNKLTQLFDSLVPSDEK